MSGEQLITKLIQSPAGQLVAGGALAGIVWRLFERVERVLDNDTKLDIAAWLSGVEAGRKLEPWPGTFARIFDRVFGTKHLSWKCLYRSVVASVAVTLLATALWRMSARSTSLPPAPDSGIWTAVLAVWAFGLLMGYLSLLKSRRSLCDMCGNVSVGRRAYVLAVDLVSAWFIAAATLSVLLTAFRFLRHPAWFRSYLPATDLLKEALRFQAFFTHHPAAVFNCHPLLSLYSADGRLVRFGLNLSTLTVYPAFFAVVWLWLYAGSGFLLKAARHFDIAKRPLRSIGLVAGALVAVVYWTAVIVSRAGG